ncbi:hypothetical protein RSOLAG22IIIB_03741 [Rhizoctonia solani]|uniref:NmrA-like domain-containing protein n=1 Tax=Rhizoctonia solani TaxID=456999 RepID=A0A0K6FSU9_9AGAM|nr:hypothetical protein RSOLAG22IIIB_03741 [Rhizoctonia solani]
MSAKVVALAGADGYVGKAFVDAFLNLNAFQIRILVRTESNELYQNLVKALHGADVLISTVAAAGLASAQIPLIKAAKQAGIKVFFPSEYGANFPATRFPFLQVKNDVVQAARDHELPVAILNNGPFPEYTFTHPFSSSLGISFADRKVTIWGEGNTKITWTTVHSVASWLANVLKSVPVSQLQNKQLQIQGSVHTLNEVVKLWEQKNNDKLQVEYRPVKEVEDRYAHFDRNDNVLYPQWKPETVESVL